MPIDHLIAIHRTLGITPRAVHTLFVLRRFILHQFIESWHSTIFWNISKHKPKLRWFLLILKISEAFATYPQNPHISTPSLWGVVWSRKDVEPTLWCLNHLQNKDTWDAKALGWSGFFLFGNRGSAITHRTPKNQQFAPVRRPGPKEETHLNRPQCFRCELLVSERVCVNPVIAPLGILIRIAASFNFNDFEMLRQRIWNIPRDTCFGTFFLLKITWIFGQFFGF